MNNKKTIFVKVGLVFAFGFLSAPIIKADVITTTIPYVDDNGVKSVNIEDLARASKGTVVENEESIDIVINDAILSIYPEKGAAFLDGDLIPLKTKTVIDNATGETFEFPICEKITENDGGHLIPVSVVSKSFGIEGEETGYVIKTEVKTEKNNNKTSNGNSSDSNDIIESSTVHTNTANSSSNNDSDENSNLNTKTEDGFENNNSNNNNDNNTENNKNDSKINEGSDN